MSAVLGDKDINAAMEQQNAIKDVKSMEYHRQVFQSKMAAEPYALLSSPAAALGRPPRPSAAAAASSSADAASRTKQYVSPSDNIMSPCTAKINALRNKHASKAKPKSLFAQASVKKLNGENALGARSIQQ
ncbi:Spo12 [Metarhizium album ARSEF 1941]|uniref:Spo12 n=1 Tax=Metarhizium album (strain ARSEF 1941) TaxID=1081103 RepID=A0A0B2X277_METAS|nr:Spo12 [Metarhizium album ARSEF 1941]KHO00339.1 Spo12 [Metarhizium album ARSEF 1941]